MWLHKASHLSRCLIVVIVLREREYPLGTAINNQYSNKGIVFGGDSPFIATDGANSTSPVLSGSPQFFGAIEGSFVDPRDGVTPATAVNFQLDAGYFDSLGSTTLKLYDTQGKLIEQRTNTGQGIFTFTVEGLPVAKWRIESVGDELAGFAIDNVCFTLQTVKQHPRPYPSYLKNGDSLEGVPDTDFPESERPLPQYFVPPVSQSQNEGDYVNQEEIFNSGTNQDSTPLSSDSLPADPTTISALSCAGIGTPLNDNTLFKIARQVRPNATDNDIRLAFEGFALDSEVIAKYSGSPFMSPERYKKTQNSKRRTYENVKPEAVSEAFIETDAPLGYGPPQKIEFRNSVFVDAKVKTKKKISLSSDDYQAQGFLDYLSHYSDAAKAYLFPTSVRPNPSLIYLTTANVGITKGVLDYTGETPGPSVPFTPVLVYQAMACLKDTKGDFTQNYLQMGWGIPLNVDRIVGYPKLKYNILPAGRPSSLKFR